ncbi:MAG: hypothetical protein ACYTEQ_19440 [Planctomycetota bacterium]
MKSESIPIEGPEEKELAPGAVPSRIAEALRAEQTEQAKPTPKLNVDFKRVKGGWDAHNGFVAESINSLDEDLRTAKMGQSVEILLDSFGVSTNRAEVCIVVSSVHFAMLKAKKMFKAKP